MGVCIVKESVVVSSAASLHLNELGTDVAFRIDEVVVRSIVYLFNRISPTAQPLITRPHHESYAAASD